MDAPQAEMPRYKCHKEVHALKIADLVRPELKDDEEWDGRMLLVPEEFPYAPFYVDAQYMRKHEPKAGGYYVVYEDGYKSYSPAGAFESGYTRQ